MSLTGTQPFKVYRTLALGASGDGVAVPVALTGARTLTFLDEQFQYINGGAADRDVTLPTADAEHKGSFYVIANAGTTNSLVIKDGVTTLATLSVGEHGIFASTATAWKAMLVTTSAASDIFGANGAYTGNNTHSGTETFSNAAGVTTDTVSERTAAAGVTIDSLLIKDGNVSADYLVRAVVAVANASGGATGAALTVDLFRLDGTTVLAGARQALVVTSSAQYQPFVNEPSVGSVTFGTATKGSIVASAAGWCLFETDADGEFDCTASNTDDETIYFRVVTAAGVSDSAKGALVVASNSDAATWSA